MNRLTASTPRSPESWRVQGGGLHRSGLTVDPLRRLAGPREVREARWPPGPVQGRGDQSLVRSGRRGVERSPAVVRGGGGGPGSASLLTAYRPQELRSPGLVTLPPSLPNAPSPPCVSISSSSLTVRAEAPPPRGSLLPPAATRRTAARRFDASPHERMISKMYISINTGGSYALLYKCADVESMGFMQRVAHECIHSIIYLFLFKKQHYVML